MQAQRQQTVCQIQQPNCSCVQCVTERSLSGKNSSTPASLGHRNPQDVMDSLDYHWKVLTPGVKHLLLDNPGQLHLKKLVDFWSQPQHIESTRGSCASSISGSSWFMALNYLFLDKLVEAQALILHGSFMQECVCKPIEYIAALCNTNEGVISSNLRIYLDAFFMTRTKQSMEAFLHKALPDDYRRRMSFACQAYRTDGHRIVDDYVNFVSNDWNGASSPSAVAATHRTKCADNTSIEVIFMKSDTNEESAVKIGMSTTMKSVFNNYADEQGLPLRSLRFTHAGQLLFLSSAGNKTTEQLGIQHHDIVHVSSTISSAQATPSSASSQKKSKSRKSALRSNKKGKGKSRRKQCSPTPAFNDASDYEQDKIQHSKQLSFVFEEAQPILKSIRQMLNSLTIERTLPKKKRQNKKYSKVAAVTPVCNPPAAGGKAGKTHFTVQVGEYCNLYKTTKRPARSLQQQKPIVTDLHGLSKDEALSKLDSSLPQWTDIAMQGSYPFVIPVMIVCGGGNQVLSETVEKWIREKGNVSNAPKNFYAL
jgi:DNA-nicking Smr family endonuclease